MHGVAHGHGVSVHNPRHGLRVGINIGRGNVLRGPDDRQNFAGIAPRHPFEFALGHALGVTNHAALRAAERHVQHGGLPRHPGRQRFYLIQRYVGMVADASFSGSSRDVVLHPVAGQHFYLPVIHLCRDGNLQHALGRAQYLPQSGIELQEFRRHIELNLRDAEGVQVFPRSNARHHRRRANLS